MYLSDEHDALGVLEHISGDCAILGVFWRQVVDFFSFSVRIVCMPTLRLGRDFAKERDFILDVEP